MTTAARAARNGFPTRGNGMKRRRRQRSLVPAVLGGALVFWGCHAHNQRPPIDDPPPQPVPAAPTTQASTANGHAAGSPRAADSKPAAGADTFDAKGIRFKLPADWSPKKNPDFELMLLPAGAQSDEPRITLDVPDLPPHLPWMIQMNRIEHDYVADLKKAHPDLKLDDASDVKIPNTVARLVRTTWHEKDQQPHDDVALLMIHANAVYILDARAQQSQIDKARAAFDRIRASMQWTK